MRTGLAARSSPMNGGTDVSMFSKVAKTVVRGVAAYYTGGASEAYYQAAARSKSMSQVPAAPAPSAGFTNGWATQTRPGLGYQPAMSVLPRLAPLAGRGVMGGLGYGAGRALGGARTIVRSAMSYCRRHPGWCSSIGGLAAVEALVSGGQLPPIRHRRARGISGRELSSFRRVSKTLNKWCKTPAPTQRARRKC